MFSMQKKKVVPLKKILPEKKKEKKISLRKVFTLSFLFFLVIVILWIQYTLAPANEHFIDYSWGCFLRSYQEWTGRNASQIYELVPSELRTSSLPTIQITSFQYEALWWDTWPLSTSHICSKNITLSYSVERHKLEKFEIQ